MLAMLAPASHAAGVRPVVVAGYDAGGDRVASMTFTTGKSDSIRANEGLYLGGGVSVLNAAGNIELLTTLSVKYQGLHADNGDITWTRFPIDALLFYRWPSFRLGGGLTYVVDPRIGGSGVSSNVDATLDNAAGALLQGDYLIDGFALGLRATLLDYKVGGSTVKASGVGVSFGFTF
jgi:hypothetical protein